MIFTKPKVKIPEDAEEMHLCYLGEDGYQAQHTKIYRKLAAHPQYRCKYCGRVSHNEQNLCAPEKL